MDLDDGAQLGRHLQPGATKYFSVRTATTEAEERYRWYTNGGLSFGLYWAEFVEVSDCCCFLFLFTILFSACFVGEITVECYDLTGRSMVNLKHRHRRPDGIMFRVTLTSSGMRWLKQQELLTLQTYSGNAWARFKGELFLGSVNIPDGGGLMYRCEQALM